MKLVFNFKVGRLATAKKVVYLKNGLAVETKTFLKIRERVKRLE
jgi:hypothetical protein